VGFGAPMGLPVALRRASGQRLRPWPSPDEQGRTLSGPEGRRARPAHPSEPIQVAENRVAGGITAGGAHRAQFFLQPENGT